MVKRIKTTSNFRIPDRFGWLALAALLALVPLFTSCSMIDKLRGKHDDDKLHGLLQMLLLGPSADYYARLYYIHPAIVSSTNNKAYIWEATAADVHAGKKKLILVHGWHFDDRDYLGNYPSPDALKDRVLSQNWSAFFGTTDYANLITAGGAHQNYDVYAFDYLTAVGVDENGARLRAKLDALFSGTTDVVVIYGHSMGGLVSRFAVYSGSDATYVTRVITTGTPFHGSPWASPQFTGNKGVLGDLALFFTDTVGGHDLGWDNYDGTLAGSSNAKLSSLDLKTSLDNRFFAYGGSYDQNAASPGAGAGLALVAACPVMGATFALSDCIVPQRSAWMTNHTVTTWDAGHYDHIDMKMGIAAIRGHFVLDLP